MYVCMCMCVCVCVCVCRQLLLCRVSGEGGDGATVNILFFRITRTFVADSWTAAPIFIFHSFVLQVTYPMPFQGGNEEVTCVMFWTATSVRFWTLSGHHTLSSLSSMSVTDALVISSWEVSVDRMCVYVCVCVCVGGWYL